MEKKDIQIEATDHYGRECLEDALIRKGESGRHPKGFVEIYEISKDGKKKKIGKSNLVTYQGREWIGERLFNTDNTYVDTTADQFISWLGLGSGGCPVGDPLNPTAPSNTDTDLDTEVPINASDPTCADFRAGAYYKHPFDSVEFIQDTDNDNKYLICRVTTTIGIDDANGYNLSEAGLFVCDSSAGGATGPFKLFSRITFPSIVKTSDRQLGFIWYIYV